MKKITAIFIWIICFLVGMSIGFLISPVKNGVGNNSGNTNNYYTAKEDEDVIIE